jgi:hypothetical protein
VGRGGAGRALDWGWEAAEATVDGKPGLRRRSGEVGCSGKRKAVEMHVCERKSESVGSSRTYFKSRKRHGGRELLLASRRHAWRLGRRRRDVEQRGEGQRRVGSGSAAARTARGAEGSGAGATGARHMAGEGGGSRARAETKQGELEVEDRD